MSTGDKWRGQVLHKSIGVIVHLLAKPAPQIMCILYRPDGTKFLTYAEIGQLLVQKQQRAQ